MGHQAPIIDERDTSTEAAVSAVLEGLGRALALAAVSVEYGRTERARQHVVGALGDLAEDLAALGCHVSVESPSTGPTLTPVPR